MSGCRTPPDRAQGLRAVLEAKSVEHEIAGPGREKTIGLNARLFSAQLIQRLDFLPTIGSGDYGVCIEKNLTIRDLTPAGSSRGRQI